jgi:hypothetical protein
MVKEKDEIFFFILSVFRVFDGVKKTEKVFRFKRSMDRGLGFWREFLILAGGK